MCQELCWGVIEIASFNFEGQLMRHILNKSSQINGGAGIQTQDLLDSKADSLSDYSMYCHTQSAQTHKNLKCF